MTQRLTREDVIHVALLARLELTDEELDRFSVQLSAVLEHASALQSRDLSNVPPTTHALAMRNVLRKDVVQESLDREEVLDVAPSKEGGRFKVPSILGDAP